MSSNGLQYTISAVDYVSGQWIQACLQYSAMTVLIYDFFLTFEDESEHIWKRKKTLSSYLFFLQRVLAVLGLMPSAASVIVMSSYYDTSCNHPTFNMMGNVTVALSEFLVSTYLFLRIYALYDKSRRLLMMGAIFMAITIAILAVILAGKDQKGAVTAGGCNIGSSPSTSLKTAVLWGFMILNDSIIFGLIINKVVEYRRQNSLPSIQTFGNTLSLQELLVRDGVMYYLYRSKHFFWILYVAESMFRAVVLVNVANMASYFFPQPLLRGSLARLSCNISTVMITRLMLNLNKMTDFGIMSSPSQISTVHFNPTSS